MPGEQLDPTEAGSARPALTAAITGTELLRWYYLRAELVDFARQIGISTAGGKKELTDRLVAALDGQPIPPPTRVTRSTSAPLEGELSLDSVIPPGQRCSQQLREFFVGQVGTQFRFDAAMRSFIADQSGATLGDAVNHWHRTRSDAPAPPAEQFELNRFTRQWYLEHPHGSREDLRRDWLIYRDTPTDRRGRA